MRLVAFAVINQFGIKGARAVVVLFESRILELESVEKLFKKMEQMFDLCKLVLRKEFKSRACRGGESFCDSYHDKIILANHVPIA